MQEKEKWSRYCISPQEAIDGNEVELLKDGDEAFPALLSAIGGAREFVLLEFYAFSDDSIGRTLGDLLGCAPRVAVYLITTRWVPYSRPGFLPGWRRAGVKAEYRPSSTGSPTGTG